tara:strand:+ start:223 stop:420 length:198 start_codon:yes stop_codon:yes gene_type:complete
MSTLQNDLIFDRLMDEFDIRPCFNGVGTWEVYHVDGTVHETYDTIDEAEKGREDIILQTFEDLCQ